MPWFANASVAYLKRTRPNRQFFQTFLVYLLPLLASTANHASNRWSLSEGIVLCRWKKAHSNGSWDRRYDWLTKVFVKWAFIRSLTAIGAILSATTSRRPLLTPLVSRNFYYIGVVIVLCINNYHPPEKRSWDIAPYVTLSPRRFRFLSCNAVRE